MIDTEDAYLLVRSGVWNVERFREYLLATASEAFEDGYEEGMVAGGYEI